MKKLFSLVLTLLIAFQLQAPGAFAKELPFSDVSPGSWYYAAVSECYNKGILHGVSPTRFAPGSPMTRAMFAKALANYSGNFKAPQTDSNLVDLEPGSWYYDAARWLASLDIIRGTGSGYFTPHRTITRAEAATMLYRYSVLCDTEYSYPEGIDVSMYDDFETIPSYAWNSVAWAKMNGIMQGVTESKFSPNSPLTRAQTAMILTRISGMNNPVYETYEYTVKWKDNEFELDLPVSWKTECLIETREELSESGRLITFYSKSNHTGILENGGTYGGRLLAFDVLPSDQPAPPNNSRAFYQFTQDGKEYTVYECRPSDVQWLDDPKGYILMYEQLDTIMKSVRPTWL